MALLSWSNYQLEAQALAARSPTPPNIWPFFHSPNFLSVSAGPSGEEWSVSAACPPLRLICLVSRRCSGCRTCRGHWSTWSYSSQGVSYRQVQCARARCKKSIVRHSRGHPSLCPQPYITSHICRRPGLSIRAGGGHILKRMLTLQFWGCVWIDGGMWDRWTSQLKQRPSFENHLS